MGAARPFRLPPIIDNLGLKHRTRPIAPSDQIEQVRLSLINCAITIAFPKFRDSGLFCRTTARRIGPSAVLGSTVHFKRWTA